MSTAYDGKLVPEADSAYGRFAGIAREAAATIGRVAVYLAVALSMRRLLLFQMEIGAAHGWPRPSLDWSAAALAMTASVSIAIHEGGHYLAGRFAGQYCRRWVLGPMEFFRRGGGWRLRWIPIRRAGLVDLVPSTFDHFRQRRAMCVAGGPIASMLTGVLCAAWSYHAPTASLYWIACYCALWSLVGSMGLLPMRRGAAHSDGYLLWQLARGGSTVDELQRSLLVASSHATPLRMREWPHDLILRLPDIAADQRPREYNSYLAYIHFLDCGDAQTAGRYLHALIADWKPTDPPEYALEAAWFTARHENDADAARQWLAREHRDTEPWVRLRAQSAIEHAAGNDARALELVDEALRQLRAAPPNGAHQYEIDRLLEIQSSNPRSSC